MTSTPKSKHPVQWRNQGVGMKKTWVSFGIPPTLKEAAKEVAADQKIPLSELIRRALTEYIGVED